MLFRVFISAFAIILGFVSHVKTESSNSSSALNLEDRIVGGVSIKIKYRNFQVAVLVGPYICGGSLITLEWVVSAAHCVYDESASSTYVRAGSNYYYQYGGTRNAKELIPHPQYNPNNYDYDISLILLESPFIKTTFIDTIQTAINLPSRGKDLVVSGYGTTSSGGSLAENLQKVVVKMISFEECQEFYSGELTERMFCAGVPKGGKDSCQGDSGGPITYNGLLLGVVSWGYGCASKDYPGVYTRIPYFNYWINNTISATY